MARPHKITPDKLKLIEEMAVVQCTYREIATIIGVHEDTLFRNKEYTEIIEKGKERGRTTLRKLMFQNAMKGNVVMQIFLSKQMLGYSDKHVIDANNKISLTLNYRLPEKDKPITAEFSKNEEIKQINS